jgi:hypothetical protein
VDLNDISVGLTLVGFATLCLSMGFLVKSQSRMLEIQTRLLLSQTDLAQALSARPPSLTELQGGWRELPERERAVLRKALREVLTEMDREMN